MTTERDLDAIYQAKLQGVSDQAIMKQFSVGLREIERAVVHGTGANLNLFSSKRTVGALVPKGFTIESTTVWSFKNRGKWATHSGEYRGNWSPYIPRNVILRYSSPGDLVLDQFCGGGTTAVEAKLLGRRCIARDINPAAIALARQNLAFDMARQDALDGTIDNSESYEPTVENGDGRSLVGIDDGSVDLICTHPPYADIVHYTDGNPADISFHNVDTFIEDMKTVAQECLRVLKPGGICAILIGDTRKNKHVVPIGFRTIEVFINQGFRLKDLIIKRQHNCRTDGFWYSSSIKHNFLLLAQEYLPVFVKPIAELATPRPVLARLGTLSTREVGVPRPPDNMECKTTWVFPSESFEEAVDANVMNRYGNKGPVLIVDSSKEPDASLSPVSRGYDLVYCKAWSECDSGKCGPVDYTRLTRLIVDKASPLVKPTGHLVIRSRDTKVGDDTISPALETWRIPGEAFSLREIIVLAHESPEKVPNEMHDLQITHEMLLVYQDKNTASS